MVFTKNVGLTVRMQWLHSIRGPRKETPSKSPLIFVECEWQQLRWWVDMYRCIQSWGVCEDDSVVVVLQWSCVSGLHPTYCSAVSTAPVSHSSLSSHWSVRHKTRGKYKKKSRNKIFYYHTQLKICWKILLFIEKYCCKNWYCMILKLRHYKIAPPVQYSMILLILFSQKYFASSWCILIYSNPLFFNVAWASSIIIMI